MLKSQNVIGRREVAEDFLRRLLLGEGAAKALGSGQQVLSGGGRHCLFLNREQQTRWYGVLGVQVVQVSSAYQMPDSKLVKGAEGDRGSDFVSQLTIQFPALPPFNPLFLPCRNTHKTTFELLYSRCLFFWLCVPVLLS